MDIIAIEKKMGELEWEIDVLGEALTRIENNTDLILDQLTKIRESVETLCKK